MKTLSIINLIIYLGLGMTGLIKGLDEVLIQSSSIISMILVSPINIAIILHLMFGSILSYALRPKKFRTPIIIN